MFDVDGKVVYEPKAAEPAVKVPFLVKVSISDLNIRKGPGTDHDRVQFIPIVVYTIMEVRICEKYCTRVQDSVFEGVLDGSELTKLLNDLKKVIDENYDSVRIYQLLNNSVINNPIIIGHKTKTETFSDDAFIL